MADMSWQNPNNMQPGAADSAVLDMGMNDGRSDISDYDNDFQESAPQRGDTKKNGDSMMENLKQKMGDNVTQMVWQAGTQGAKRAWSIYGNIDVLRPYFDVEPKEVLTRLMYSLIPMWPTDQRLSAPKELYGPLMVVLTLIALLLYQMKSAQHSVEEGTLMGTAFGECFIYWFGSSCLVWFVSYVCNIRMALLQVLSLMGYALFGHCIVIFLGTVVHTNHDHMLFYLLWAVFGGLSSLRVASIISSRTRVQRQKLLIIIGTIVSLHLLFLLNLHFSYHSMVEALSADLVPAPIKVEIAPDKPLEMDKVPNVLSAGAAIPQGKVNKMVPDLVHSITKGLDSISEKAVHAARNDTVKAVGQVTMAVVNKAGILLDKMKPGLKV